MNTINAFADCYITVLFTGVAFSMVGVVCLGGGGGGGGGGEWEASVKLFQVFYSCVRCFKELVLK